MGYITLSIKRNDEVKSYIVVDAEYLNESWLAEARPDNTTKIIKQFKCKKFKNCFQELTDCMVHLGEVVELTANDVEPRNVNRLRNILSRKILEIQNHTSQHALTGLLKRIQHSFLAPIIDYRLLSL
jgi:hypothetical protein